MYIVKNTFQKNDYDISHPDFTSAKRKTSFFYLNSHRIKIAHFHHRFYLNIGLTNGNRLIFLLIYPRKYPISLKKNSYVSDYMFAVTLGLRKSCVIFPRAFQSRLPELLKSTVIIGKK